MEERKTEGKKERKIAQARKKERAKEIKRERR